MRSIALAAGILSILSTPAHAQTRGSDVAHECWKQEKSHISAERCEGLETRKTEQRLAQIYSDAREEALAQEADERGESVAYEKLAADLDAAQKAFEAYMKEECGYEAHPYGAGTFASDAVNICRIDLMDQRITRLQMFSRQKSPSK